MLLQKAIRGLSFVTVLGFSYALTRFVSAPGGTNSRLLFFALLLGLAYSSLAGLVLDTPAITVICAALLLVLGFTQFVLFVYILPTAMVLMVDGVSSVMPPPLADTGEDSLKGTS